MRGITVAIDAEAVIVTSAEPLTVLSSAVVNGGLTRARAVVNLRVRKNDPCLDPPGMLAEYARRAAVPAPCVGLLTSAWTQYAVQAAATGVGLAALAVATVGLSNRLAAGRSPVPAPAWSPATINTIVVIDAAPTPAALVNALITATEVKALALLESGLCGPDGGPVTGTSTDAIVIAATGRGPRCEFGGPLSALGWTVARAVQDAMARGIGIWRELNAAP